MHCFPGLLKMAGLSDNVACMSLYALGISHQTAPVAIRERVAFTGDALPGALRSLIDVPGVNECAVLSTCNRTEIYAEGGPDTAAAIIDWMHVWHQLSGERLDRYFYTLPGPAAVSHLIRVTASLDSMVLGEPQITGQVKTAWQAAADNGCLGSILDRLFQHAFAATKRVRTETEIGRNPVTLPYAALKLARQIFGDTDTLTVLLVGAGEMIEDCATHFTGAGLKRITVANRSEARARALSARFGGDSAGLERLPELLRAVDIVVTSTSSRQPILGAAMLHAALRHRRHRPFFILDLAVPRDVAPEVGELDDAYLYGVDDLQAIVEQGRNRRSEATAIAEAIVTEETRAFERWLNLRTTSDTLRRLRARAERERERLLEEARQALAAGQDSETVMSRLAHRLSNRLLHGPSKRLRQAAEQADETLLEAGRYFFDEDEDDRGSDA